MGTIQTTQPVKLLIGVISKPEAWTAAIMKELRGHFGEPDYESPTFDFDTTSFYGIELGRPLKKRFISFCRLIDPGELAPIKLLTNRIEAAYSENGKRTVNLDPGYLDYNKVVLASVKNAGQKILLKDGIYADFILWYRKGAYASFEWTFPDFKDGRYNKALLDIRRLYKESMQVSKKGDSEHL